MKQNNQELNNLIMRLLVRTHERLTRALEIIENADDPAPGPDFVEVAGAIYEALAAFDVFIMSHRQSARDER
ncbi:hypothetical protein QM467_15865 [Rhodoblastus sp. 17X3]|uniref:hypothetical protein n=1 Tax=Rhodoblastus sp. 17X3 TaxID=3047026 RepID=UPI0024B737A6|nr:hypothetical protein [Rhodoblastus sp. 17X3]MDI9849532.1 hypothetical protein [Rhodoblastus sp. 17X3]